MRAMSFSTCLHRVPFLNTAGTGPHLKNMLNRFMEQIRQTPSQHQGLNSIAKGSPGIAHQQLMMTINTTVGAAVTPPAQIPSQVLSQAKNLGTQNFNQHGNRGLPHEFSSTSSQSSFHTANGRSSIGRSSVSSIARGLLRGNPTFECSVSKTER